MAVDYVFFNLAGAAYERSVLKVARHLAREWSSGTRPKMYVYDFTELKNLLLQHSKLRYVQVLLKRFFYRYATWHQQHCGAEALVTGESLGQVSSQTLQNLSSIEKVTDALVLRPLVTASKVEIIALCRVIGTASLSSSIPEFCQLSDERPATATREASLCFEENKLPREIFPEHFASLPGSLRPRYKEINLCSLTSQELLDDYLWVRELPPEGTYTLIDLADAAWDETAFLASCKTTLDKKKTYILQCAQGVQSAYLAEQMQNMGFQAYSFLPA